MALNIVKHDASFKIANNLYPTMCKVFNDINQQTLKKIKKKEISKKGKRRLCISNQSI